MHTDNAHDKPWIMKGVKEQNRSRILDCSFRLKQTYFSQHYLELLVFWEQVNDWTIVQMLQEIDTENNGNTDWGCWCRSDEEFAYD